MTDTAAASPDSFFSGVNDFLGTVNAFGVTAANVRDRFRRPTSPSPQAVPVEHNASVAPQQAGGASKPAEAPGINWEIVLYVSLGLLAVGVVYKLTQG